MPPRWVRVRVGVGVRVRVRVRVRVGVRVRVSRRLVLEGGAPLLDQPPLLLAVGVVEGPPG